MTTALIGERMTERDDWRLRDYMDKAASKAARQVADSIQREISRMHEVGVERMSEYTNRLSDLDNRVRKLETSTAADDAVASLKRRFWYAVAAAVGSPVVTWLLLMRR